MLVFGMQLSAKLPGLTIAKYSGKFDFFLILMVI